MVEEKPLKLNLGAGMVKREGFVNVGINPDCKPDLLFDLINNNVWPWADNSVDVIHVENFVEHLTGEQLIEFMNKCWVVMKPGTTITITTPHRKSKWSWIDVTHKLHLDEHGMDFFMVDDWNSRSAGVEHYFEGMSWNFLGWELVFVLRKPEAKKV